MAPGSPAAPAAGMTSEGRRRPWLPLCRHPGQAQRAPGPIGSQSGGGDTCRPSVAEPHGQSFIYLGFRRVCRRDLVTNLSSPHWEHWLCARSKSVVRPSDLAITFTCWRGDISAKPARQSSHNGLGVRSTSTVWMRCGLSIQVRIDQPGREFDGSFTVGREAAPTGRCPLRRHDWTDEGCSRNDLTHPEQVPL